jgi:hypothetical protein
MTRRREKALRAARRIRGGATASGGDLYALADEVLRESGYQGPTKRLTWLLGANERVSFMVDSSAHSDTLVMLHQ